MGAHIGRSNKNVEIIVIFFLPVDMIYLGVFLLTSMLQAIIYWANSLGDGIGSFSNWLKKD